MEVIETITREKTCQKCGDPLKHFITYIPSHGEVCMKCYTEYAKEHAE